MSNLPEQNTKRGITNLYLNPNAGEEWDIVIRNGQLVTISDKEYIAQKVTQLLRTCKGECVTSINHGVPYFDDIIGVKNPNLTMIGHLFTDVIMENQVLIDLGVTSCTIQNIELTKDRELLIKNLLVSVGDESVTINEVTI